MNSFDIFLDPLFSLSPIDGRYREKVNNLREIFSEYGLIKRRIYVEIKWFLFLIENLKIEIKEKDKLNKLISKIDNFSIEDARRIKEIEKITNHDVKAVEYFLKEICQIDENEFIHFCLTSEDINNLSYALMIKDYLREIFIKEIQIIIFKIKELSLKYKDSPMLSKTHGQPATPTTFGKEVSYFLKRIFDSTKNILSIDIYGKINGATGNFAAHFLAYPEIDWIEFTKRFLNSLGISQNIVTKQIEPHDFISRILNEFSILNGVLIDLCRDFWLYISNDYLKLKKVETEVGSSTMPHKVNPIDFENAWGNFEISQNIAQFLSRRLIVSLMQRDLTDSTLLRNLSLVFSYFNIGLSSLIKGLEKIELNEEKTKRDLMENPEVLSEAIQTIMRKNKIKNGYEILKGFTRGRKINFEVLNEFVKTLDINEADRNRLINLYPENYIGLSSSIVDKVVEEIDKNLDLRNLLMNRKF
ncbi:MAG: adenylosuccinate lyase [Spirochaetes bacterium]|nr:adenylosuccinate lyase [Spirochaetota bacterium]